MRDVGNEKWNMLNWLSEMGLQPSLDVAPYLKLKMEMSWSWKGPKSLRVLSTDRVRTPVSKGNQIHSSTLWTLGIQKMHMGTLGYKGKWSL